MAKKITQTYVLKVIAENLAQTTAQLRVLSDTLNKQTVAQDKVTKGHRTASKTIGEYDRNQKGAANATNNSTKAFSKMAQGMQGTLVPAYATVAANVFALTAAFGALERAADFTILIESAETLATQTGRSLIGLAKNMREITGGAINMKEALQSASIAASAGFDNSTIEQLTQVSRNASVALGRDLTDSLNRVFRGAIKAEPELLDELGIILRLEPATKKYAAELGKTAKELTTFEKQQAIVNEVLAQGNEKFEEFGDIPVNQYSVLAANFQTIATQLIELVNIPIGGFLSFFAENTIALTGAIVLFSNKVLQAAIPAINALGNTIENVVDQKFSKLNVDLFGDLIAKDFVETFKDINFDEAIHFIAEPLQILSEISSDEAEAITKNLGSIFSGDFIDSEEKVQRAFEAADQSLKDIANSNQKLTPELRKTIVELQDIRSKAGAALGIATEKYTLFGATISASMTKSARSVAIFTTSVKAGLSTGFFAGLQGGLSNVASAANSLSIKFKEVARDQIIVGKTTQALSLALLKLSGAFGSVLRGVFKLIPVVGTLMIAWEVFGGALSTAARWLGLISEESEEFNKVLDESSETMKTINKTIVNYEKNLSNLPATLDNTNKKLTAQKNILTEITNTLDSLNTALKSSDGFGTIDELVAGLSFGLAGDLVNYRKQVEQALSAFRRSGLGPEIAQLLKSFDNFTTVSALTTKELERLGAELEKLGTKGQKSTSELLYGTEQIGQSFDDLQKSTSDYIVGLSNLDKVENLFLDITNLSDIVNSLEDNITSVQLLASGYDRLSESQAKALNLDKEISVLGELGGQLKKTTDELSAASIEWARFQALRDKINAIDVREGDNAKLRRDAIFAEAGVKNVIEWSERYNEVRESFEDLLAFMKALQKIIGIAVEDVNEKLGSSISIYENLINAQKNYNKAINSLNLKKLNPNLDLQERIKLLNITRKIEEDLFNAQHSYNTRLYAQTKETINENNKILQDSASTIDDINRARSQLETSRREKLLLEKSLQEDLLKLDQSRISEIKDLMQELDNVAKSEGLGIIAQKSSIEVLSIIEDRLKNISFAAEDTKEKLIEALQSSIESTKLSVRVPVTAEGVAADIINIEDTIKSYKIEQEYLREFNSLMDDRLDREFLLKQAIAERQILEVSEALQRGDIKGEAAVKYNQLILQLAKQVNAAREGGLAIVETELAATIKKADIERKSILANLAAGLRLTKAAQLDLELREKAAEKQEAVGKDNLEKADEAIEAIRLLNKESLKLDIQNQLSSSLDSVSEFSDAMKELRENIAKLGEEDSLAKFQAGLLAINKIAVASGSQAAVGLSNLATLTNQFGEDLKTTQDRLATTLEFASGAMGSIAQALGEGSKAAEILKVAQTGLALVSAVNAVLTQGEGDPFSAFARMAAMASAAAALLSQIGVSFGSSGISGAGAGDRYRENIGTQGLYGIDLQTNSLVDSIDSLVEIDTELFSANRDLQLAIIELSNTFKSLGAASFKAGGSFETLDVADFFGVSFNSGGSSDFFGLGSTSKTRELISAGYELGAAITFVGDEIIASAEEARAFLVLQVTKTKSGVFGIGSKTKVRLEESFKDLPADVARELQSSLDNTTTVITGLISSFGSAVEVDLVELFSSLGTINIDPIRIDLVGKSAEEQADAIAAFFSNLSNEVIGTALPFLTKFSQAGEELTDTLIRLTEQTLNISDIFSSINLDLSDVAKVTGSEQLKLEILASWQEAFTSSFKDFDELDQLFEDFASSIFSEAELTELALERARGIVSVGFSELRTELANAGREDLLSTLADDTSESLRAFYDLALATDTFTARVNTATGEIDTSGADLLAIVIQLGAALKAAEETAEELTSRAEELNLQYTRQIELFGLLGKELDLLALEFDFQDAIQEAIDEGADITLVEKIFGLERLKIIKDYNQEALDEIKSATIDLQKATNSFLSSFDQWNDVIFLGIKLEKLSKSLQTGLGSIASGIDFSVFSNLNDVIDEETFLDTFEGLFTIFDSVPTNITEQIDLVLELKDAVIERYNIEQQEIQNTINRFKELSDSINEFLDELLVGDLSPLTNSERLAEASRQFYENIDGIFSTDTDISAAAADNLISSAETLLNIASEFFSISGYRDLFVSVTDALKQVDESLLDRINLSEEAVAINEQTDILSTLQLETIEKLQVLDSILYVLEEQQQATLVSDIEQLSELLIPHLDFITDKLQSLNDSTWVPILEVLRGLNSFASGTQEVDADQLAMIHKGETILPRKTAESIRSGESVLANSTNITNNTTTDSDNSDIINAIKILTDVVAVSQEDLLDQGKELIQVSRDRNKIRNPLASTAKIL